MTPSNTIFLVESQFNKVIIYKEQRGNLALTTCVVVNTTTNSCTLKYTVDSWNAAHKELGKEFKDYHKAFKYYVETYEKYKTP